MGTCVETAALFRLTITVSGQSCVPLRGGGEGLYWGLVDCFDFFF